MSQKQLYYIISFAILISLMPFLWLFTQTERMGGFLFGFANIAGFLGTGMMLWQFILGTRSVTRLLSPNYVSFIKFHIFLGVYGSFFVLIHPVLEMIAYTEGFWFLFLPDFSSTYATHITYGRFAFILFLFIWITSAFLRDKMSYRPWLYIHYLSYPLMVFVFIHAFQIGTYIFTIPFIKWYWIFLTGVFSVLVLWRLSRIFNLDKARYEVVSKEHKPDKITVYTLKPRGKELHPDPGQFIYIKPSFFAEAHPFSVLNYEKSTGEISFGIKAVGHFTRLLRTIDVNQTVYLEGPYGVFTREGQNADPKVIFAGGIGVVPFYELVKRFGGKKTIMFYSNKKLEDALYREEFVETLGSSYIDAVTREDPKDMKGNTVLKGRITQDVVESYLNNEFLSKGKFFICGSPGFMAGITKILKNLGVPQSRVHMEEFGF